MPKRAGGAADGSPIIALQVERCKLEGTDFGGGVTDIFKCVGQLVRRRIYKLMELGGASRGVLSADQGYHEKKRAHNSIVGGQGKGYHSTCSIPQ